MNAHLPEKQKILLAQLLPVSPSCETEMRLYSTNPTASCVPNTLQRCHSDKLSNAVHYRGEISLLFFFLLCFPNKNLGTHEKNKQINLWFLWPFFYVTQQKKTQDKALQGFGFLQLKGKQINQSPSNGQRWHCMLNLFWQTKSLYRGEECAETLKKHCNFAVKICKHSLKKDWFTWKSKWHKISRLKYISIE